MGGRAEREIREGEEWEGEQRGRRRRGMGGRAERDVGGKEEWEGEQKEMQEE